MAGVCTCDTPGQVVCPAWTEGPIINPAKCANQKTDTNHCGACGIRCPNVAQICLDGRCCQYDANGVCS